MPRVQKKGFEEFTEKGAIKEGDTYWEVQLDRDGQYNVKTQFEAEVMSRLVRIERILKHDKRRMKK